MMDDDLVLALVDAFRPFEIIPVRRFAIFVDDLFIRRDAQKIIGSHLTLIFLFLYIKKFLRISLHELIEFRFLLLLAFRISLSL